VGAGGVPTARPALHSSTSFPRCDDVITGDQPTTAPDGTLVYGYGYYLHSVRPDGTHERTLFSAEEPVRFPTVSPDGKLIAFDQGSTSDEIWVMNSDGSGSHYVASGTSPAFSPDGSHLAFGGAPTTDQRVALDVIGIDGSGRRTLATNATDYPEPAWSPDGTTILFDSYRLDYVPRPVVAAVNADGSGERVFAGGRAANWSADGGAVALSQSHYERGSSLDVVNAGGKGLHELVPSALLFNAYSPTWSRDGKQVTYAMTPVDEANPGHTEGVFWQVDATGRGRHPLASNCRFGTGGADRLRGTPRADNIYGLEGNDRIDVQGGGRDVVNCGSGRDVARADRRDVIARNCERRRR
jgi:Tol biopolymer transport system component